MGLFYNEGEKRKSGMNEEFELWWNKIGSGITPLPHRNMEEHAKRVSQEAWEASWAELGRRTVEIFDKPI